MAEVRLRALILREVDFGDFDRYLTVLTEYGRKSEILYKNARRGKKQNPAARQFCFIRENIDFSRPFQKGNLFLIRVKSRFLSISRQLFFQKQ